MKTRLDSARFRSLFVLIAAVVGMSLFVAGCGDDDDDDGGGGGGGEAAAGAPECGPGGGEKASGQPIKLGGIATKQPGTDFSDIPNMAKAFFDCVNDNGGINGRPVQYLIETEQTDPGQAANAAVKLAENDRVLGFVGNTSLIEGAVNHEYYEQNGFYVICSGIAPEAYTTSNMACVNMGPRYSSDGATQAVLRQDVDKLVFDQSNVPGTEYIVAGPELITEDAGVEFVGLKDNVPIQDANSVALKLVQEAGENGGIVLNFTPPEALKILQAAQQQGIQNQVKAWGCSTPCNTNFLAEALGGAWDDQLLVNAELNLTDAEGPDSELYRQVLEEYGQDVAGGAGSFSQMGFIEAKIATDALAGVGGELTQQSVNDAFKNVSNYKTDILCNPWYFGEAPLHIPNNVDRTVTPQGDKMVEKEACFEVSDVDPDIAQVRQIEERNPELIGG